MDCANYVNARIFVLCSLPLTYSIYRLPWNQLKSGGPLIKRRKRPSVSWCNRFQSIDRTSNRIKVEGTRKFSRGPQFSDTDDLTLVNCQLVTLLKNVLLRSTSCYMTCFSWLYTSLGDMISIMEGVFIGLERFQLLSSQR